MTKRNRKKGAVGSTFDDFLKEDGTYESTQAVAIKRVLAWRIGQAMEKKHITKFEAPRPPWGSGLGEKGCRPGRERRRDCQAMRLACSRSGCPVGCSPHRAMLTSSCRSRRGLEHLDKCAKTRENRLSPGRCGDHDGALASIITS